MDTRQQWAFERTIREGRDMHDLIIAGVEGTSVAGWQDKPIIPDGLSDTDIYVTSFVSPTYLGSWTGPDTCDCLGLQVRIVACWHLRRPGQQNGAK